MNDVIENFIITREWAIDLQYGLSQLAQLQLNTSLFGKTEKEPLHVKTIEHTGTVGFGQSGKTKVYNIKELGLIGPMIAEDQMCTYGIRSLANEIYDAYSDSNVDGILIIGNTGGGEAAAGKLLYSALKDANKPVVFHAQMLASGGIWGSLPATEIVGDIDGQFGSVGAYLSISKDVLKMLNDQVLMIYAKQSPRKNKVIKSLMDGQTLVAQEYVNELAQDFINLVKPKLNKDDPNYQYALEGDMFNAKQAKSLGLIDSIGTKNQALQRLVSHINYSKK